MNSGACGGQKRTSDSLIPLELELYTVMFPLTWVLEAKLGTIFNH